MNTPQLENGYVSIANEVWEALGSYRLSGEENQILNCVIRKTYGFNKKTDHISLSQFQKYTGMNRPAVARAIKKLVSKKILGSIKKDTTSIKKDTSTITLYWFNKLYSEWEPSIKKDTRGSINIDKRVVSKKIPTKDIYTKDIYIHGDVATHEPLKAELLDITKTTNTPINSYIERFNNKFGSKYTPTTGREHKLKLRLKNFTIDQILEATNNLSESEFHTGKNDRGWKADPDFLIRNDEQVDNWLNKQNN